MNNAAEGEIWALEEKYFTSLYKADYEAVLEEVVLTQYTIHVNCSNTATQSSRINHIWTKEGAAAGNY